MLVEKKNLIIIPINCSIKFLVCFNSKFLIVNVNKYPQENYFVLIPKFIQIIKQGVHIFLSFKLFNKEGITKKFFFNYFQNLLNSFRLKNFKQLLLLGLGLKIFCENSIFLMRLGFSHSITIPNIYNYVSNCVILKIGLKGFLITFYGFNKTKMGNLVEKIYKLRPADCYKKRGFNYKNKFNILKIVKKK